MLRRIPLLLSGAALIVACAADSDAVDTSASAASPPGTASDQLASASAPVNTEAAVATEAPSTTMPASEPLDELGLLSPGRYTSDLLSLDLELTTTESFRLERADPGMIVIDSLDSTGEAYRGVAFMVVDTLIHTDAAGRHLARSAASADLDEFLRSRDRMEVIERRTDELGGMSAEVWRVAFPEPCDDCWFPALFHTTGFQNQWGHPPGYVQEYWAVDAPGAPIIVAVEGPEASFDAWNEEVDEHLFAGLRFGAPTGFSLALPPMPSGNRFDGFGEFAIGRAELEVIDGSRPTGEVRDDRGLVVPPSEARNLLLSVSYPSGTGGFDAPPAAGSFPLVVVAPALFDSSISLPAERQLASHGFVVVTVRFPESSFPGGFVFGVPQQPADVSFVVDEIQRSALPVELAAVTDIDRLGLIGHSGGATTGFGLLTSECCQDPRFDAIVTHAGTPFDFNSARLPSQTPILHVASEDDGEIAVDQIRDFHNATDGPSTLAVIDGVDHLVWLDPESETYSPAFELALTFLDEHLRGGPGGLAEIADDSVFVEVSSR